MMLAYAMLSITAVWRAQTQLPPVPQREVRSYLDDWYRKHRFHENTQTLILVFDSRVTDKVVSLPPHHHHQRFQGPSVRAS